MAKKRRSPHKAGDVAQAGGLSAWEVYRTATLDDVERACERLARYASETDTPVHVAVEAADLLDAARTALGGAA